QGWNRMLVKLCGSGAALSFHPSKAAPYATKNVKWIARLPQCAAFTGNASSPVVLDDNVYLTMEPGDLVCFGRGDGKIKWIRTLSFLDTLDAEGRKALLAKAPESASFLDDAGRLAAQLEAADKDLVEKLNAIPRDQLLKGLDDAADTDVEQ